MIDTRVLLDWGHDALRLIIDADQDGRPRLRHLGAPDTVPRPAGSRESLPLVEAVVGAQGPDSSSRRLVDSVGARLRYLSHDARRDGDWHQLTVRLHDPETDLAADVVYRSPDGIPVLRAHVELRNGGSNPLDLESVTSLVLGVLTTDPAQLVTADLLWAENDWMDEHRWQRCPLRQVVPHINGRVHQPYRKGAFTIAGKGSCSSGGHLPMGALSDRGTGRTWLWQLETNGGGWQWECGENMDTGFLSLSGPTNVRHGWSHRLEPGASFTTVPVALALTEAGGIDGAFAALTRYRRAIRRPHPDHQHLPVIFNDYMNCLMGDPTTARLLPHIDAAAEAGAEYFVIDAGWYDDGDGGWWTTVGAWEPAPSRFPGEGGLGEVMDRIRERGMVPGLWLEPEVVGVESPVATALPDAAFFRRHGARVNANGRYHLDLRHPAARAHLDSVVDRLVDGLGIGYFKLDYNVDAGSGTSSHPGEAPADGLLGHNRAFLDWLDGVLDRHPGLVLESCASGGKRADHALLSRVQLHSTSDQQNLELYAPIAAAAPTAVTPEQGAVWAYPLPDDSLDEVAFTMASALLGRIHLSGLLPELAPEALALAHEAVAVHKTIRGDLAAAVPAWPLGLPGWYDPWVALALHTPDTTYVTVWRRPGDDSDESAVLPFPTLRGAWVGLDVLYPSTTKAQATWDPEAATLDVSLPSAPSAVLLRLSTRPE
ncbi:alpha-galactosidase [Streptomyces luteogriseus]|uniref:Alpha-galactosidase n=1 Tax=Streptomyces luteogriseus TaxID=68233 RepID=A0A7W7GD59_9ACTN|nr:alpha-galactosidase [Streptomyces luteogriseus]MBB4710777.1 alpha-galactosidase [Streptomyces luteogriseus]